MSDAGAKIIAALQDAIDGNLARVTIGGVTWAPVKNQEEVLDLVKAVDNLSQISDEIYVKMSNDESSILQEAWDKLEKALGRVRGLV